MAWDPTRRLQRLFAALRFRTNRGSGVSSTPLTIRPSPALVRLVAAVALFALAALVFPSLVLATIAIVAIIAILAAFDWSTSRREPALQVERVIPERLVKGRPAELRCRVSRPGGGATVVWILDELPADLGGDLLVNDVPLARNQHLEIDREVMPVRRGTCAVGTLFVAWRSRIGLWRIRAAKSATATIAIRPHMPMLHRRSSLMHRSLFDELGVRPKTARGEGSEFESLREYVPGDDPRHVDWHASARRGRLILRQFQTERRHTLIVAIDTGRLMAARSGTDSKLDYAVECGIALARASQEYGDRVGFLGFDRELRVLARPKPGRSGVGLMIEATMALRPRPFEPSYRVLVETLARCQRKRALVVVLTDFVEGSASRELEAWLSVLARRHCVMLVALRDRLLAELDQPEPEISLARLYRRLALQDLVVEREAALGRIRRLGVQTLDLDPANITMPVLNRYLAIRQGGLL
jgi:uncharacterized protein (DUF58 family)